MSEWLTPTLFGLVLMAVAALFIGISIYNRRAHKRGITPGVYNYQQQPQPNGGNRQPSGPNNNMSKSGATSIPAGSVKTRFSDVAGCDEAKEELEEVVEFVRDASLFKELGGRIPTGALLVGPPGTGKTLLARAVAGESNASFFTISGSQFVEMYVGVGAARVRDLFEEARKHLPAIIFIDEFDAVGRKRSSGPNANDERDNTLNQLLVELDGFVGTEGLMVLAATNRVDILDPALLRPGRFDRQVPVELPDRVGRRKILDVHVKKKPIARDVNLDELAAASFGFSGAQLEAVTNEAATMARRRIKRERIARGGMHVAKIITAKDFDEGLARVQMGGSGHVKAKSVSMKQRMNVAVHEIGHAWLAEESGDGSTVNRITIMPRARSAGHVFTTREEENSSMTRFEVEARLMMLLGGRIAQEVVLDTADSGASSDYQNAVELARTAVIRWGLSRLGVIGGLTAPDAESGGMLRQSEHLLRTVDDEIKSLLSECQTKARVIVERDKAHIEAAAKVLVERETMLADEWRALRRQLQSK